MYLGVIIDDKINFKYYYFEINNIIFFLSCNFFDCLLFINFRIMNYNI